MTLLVITTTQALTRLTDAAAERLTGRGRAQATRAAIAAPPRLKVANRDRAGRGRTAGAPRREHRRGRG